MTDISRMPVMDMCSVLGIGVAERVSASISLRISFICSLWPTPKRCSSSIIRRPRSLNRTDFESSLCVPTTTSIVPFLSPSITRASSEGVLNRESSATLTGKPEKRAARVL